MLNARGLLYRYILALSLIALFVTTAYSVSKFARMKGTENAKIINISGRQRMLSQRITYYAYLYSLAADANNVKKVFMQSALQNLLGCLRNHILH